MTDYDRRIVMNAGVLRRLEGKIAATEERLSKGEVARRFKVDRVTVYCYLKCADQGSLKAKTSPERTCKLNPEQLQALQRQSEAHSDDTLIEHIERATFGRPSWA